MTILRDLDDESKSQPMFYSWVNVTCHPEVLDYFEIDRFQVPTAVFYYPEKHKQANMIGKFDKETIQDHVDRYLRGKLAIWSPKQGPDAFYIEEKDCKGGSIEEMSEADRLLEEEIMREIMEEQAAKDAEAKAAEESSKKKKKGKKKGKKGSKKEDL